MFSAGCSGLSMAEAAERDVPAATPMEAHAGAPPGRRGGRDLRPDRVQQGNAVAEAVADRLGTDVVSADAMRVYRGLEILTNQPERPTRLVGICSPLRRDEHPGLRRARARRARPSRRRAWDRRGLRRDRPLPPCRSHRRPRRPPRPWRGRIEARIAREVDDDRIAAHQRLAGLDPPRPRSSTERPPKRLVRALSSSRRPARHSSPVAAGSGGTARGTRRWSRASTFPCACSSGASASRRRRCSPRRRRRGAGGARGSSRVPPKTLSGLAEIAELGPDALEPLVVRTRRYAAYQRKWMRRIPDLVRFDGDRSPGRGGGGDRRPCPVGDTRRGRDCPGSLSARCASRSGTPSGTRTCSSSSRTRAW